MKKKIYLFVPIILIFILLFTFITPVITMSENITNKVFRLHILANSDSDYDQKLKLDVRDRILELSNDIFESCSSVDDAISASSDSISYIEDEAQKVVAYYGYDYDVNAYVTKEYFNTRVYDDFTLPAGVYDSLKIEIGEAKGHNWWCVMFPTVCLSGCTDDLEQELTDDEMNMIKSNNYIVRFKIVEIYEKIKSKF